MMRQNSWNAMAVAINFMSQHHRIKTCETRMVRRDQPRTPFRNIFEPLDFHAKIFMQAIQKDIWNHVINQKIFLSRIKLHQVLKYFFWLFQKVLHDESLDLTHPFRNGEAMKKTEKKYILAIDQGTTGSTLSLVNTRGEIVNQVDQDFQQIYPKPGWVEHRPEEIWKTVASNIPKLLSRSKVKSIQIAAIGITNQRETIVMWNKKTSKPIHNALVWQDRRTSEFCDSIKKAGHEALIKKKTGLVIDPYFSASKIHWLLKKLSPVIKDTRVGTIDSFLVDRLSQGESHITDVSNASRTQLMNIETCDWDDELLKIFSVPKSILPRIVSSSGLLAKTKGLKFLPDDIPIAGIAGDQQAALFGQNCLQTGEAKCTFGTGSFLLINTGEKRSPKKFATAKVSNLSQHSQA
jgi:glycerol kinase